MFFFCKILANLCEILQILQKQNQKLYAIFCQEKKQSFLQNFAEFCRFWKTLKNAILDAIICENFAKIWQNFDEIVTFNFAKISVLSVNILRARAEVTRLDDGPLSDELGRPGEGQQGRGGAEGAEHGLRCPRRQGPALSAPPLPEADFFSPLWLYFYIHVLVIKSIVSSPLPYG